MNLCVIVADLPFRTHSARGVTAINLISYGQIAAYRKAGHRVDILPLLEAESAYGSYSAEAIAGEISALEALGAQWHPPIQLAPQPRTRTLGKLLGPLRIADFYPAIERQVVLQEHLRRHPAELIISLWAPQAAALAQGCGLPHLSYQGDVDFQPAQTRLENPAVFGATGLKDQLLRPVRQRQLRRYQQAHDQLVFGVTGLANVSANNAEYYRKLGHPHVSYVGNSWPDAGAEIAARNREAARARHAAGAPFTIIGHVGNLVNTGSRYGLLMLQESLGEIERALDGLDYQIKIIGAGRLPEMFAPLSQHPRVRVEGYVEDLDAELDASDALLLLNNAGPYKAAYTRHMMSWARGLCLVAHQDSRLAIPEIEAGRDSLLAGSARDLGEALRRALTDIELNDRLRAEGRALYEAHFTSQRLADKLLAEAAALLGQPLEKVR